MVEDVQQALQTLKEMTATTRSQKSQAKTASSTLTVKHLENAGKEVEHANLGLAGDATMNKVVNLVIYMLGGEPPAQSIVNNCRDEDRIPTSTMVKRWKLKPPTAIRLFWAFVLTLPCLAASNPLEGLSTRDNRLDYFCCTVLLSWWACTWLLLWACERYWRYDLYCLLQRIKHIGGIMIIKCAVIGFLVVVFSKSGGASTPEISATLSTFLVWLVAGGYGAWISQATMKHARALTIELATPRYRIAIRRHFPSATSTLLDGCGKSRNVQVVKAYMPLGHSSSGWSSDPTRWWAHEWQYEWNGQVFWNRSNSEVYVVMKSAQERLGPQYSISTISVAVSQSNVLELFRIRVQATMARLPNVVWQAQVCRVIVTMLLEDSDVRAGTQSNNGELCGVKLTGGTIRFEENEGFVANARSLASVCVLALWEDARVFYQFQHFIDDMYAAIPNVIGEWEEDEVNVKMRELALDVLLNLQGGV